MYMCLYKFALNISMNWKLTISLKCGSFFAAPDDTNRRAVLIKRGLLEDKKIKMDALSRQELDEC